MKKKSTGIFAILISCIVFFAGCKPEPTPEPGGIQYRIAGRVMDAMGKKGVEGIKVTLGKYKTTTTSTGYYYFTNNVNGCKIAPENYCITLKLEDRTVNYDVKAEDFSEEGTAMVPDFYSGFDERDGLQFQKVGDMYKLLPDDLERSTETVQGLAIDGDEMFVFHNNGDFYCYDISAMRFLYSGDLDPENKYNIHCNEAFFGPEKMNKDSEHTLLYVSECSSLYNIYIYDITSEGSTLYGTLDVAEKIPTSSFTYDRENGWLYAHNTDWICRYRFPSLSEFKDGKYTISFNTDQLQFITFEPGLTLPQGACARGGKFYMPSGVFPSLYCYLYIYDFATSTTKRIDINDIGLEPEGIDEVNGWFYVAFNRSCRDVIYRFRPKNQ